ncbi:DUF4167 domain-containing protein [uncultured Jannaschia sp.]|uniref:DUF4167 domain-containing protein n=1 Tax=uncultured Jannaschia sp. TaxID=293347 RepID=UPI00260204BC|nr:DUF4167 domain-containing protein [uncultured Jannaschia sp.]
MRSSKSRSRNKNRNRPQGGNIVNRVFDSSGPEGKVRGTPAQVIEKYNQLARDAQLSGDRVALENFQQHAEHYTRMLAAAQKEMDARQQNQQGNQQGGNQQANQHGGNQQGGNQNDRQGSSQGGQPSQTDRQNDRQPVEAQSADRQSEARRDDERAPRADTRENARTERQAIQSDVAPADTPTEEAAPAPSEPRNRRKPGRPRKTQPPAEPANAADVIDTPGAETGPVETPESQAVEEAPKPEKPKRGRPRKKAPAAEAPAAEGETPSAATSDS